MSPPRHDGIMAQDPLQPDRDHERLAEQDAQWQATRSGAASAPVKRTILPADLSAALKSLPETEVQRLANALAVELQRRGTGAASAVGAMQRSDRSRPPRPKQPSAGQRADDGVADLPVAKLNAVRAAIRAGVKPTVAARQFGVSLSAIRRALNKG